MAAPETLAGVLAGTFFDFVITAAGDAYAVSGVTSPPEGSAASIEGNLLDVIMRTM